MIWFDSDVLILKVQFSDYRPSFIYHLTPSSTVAESHSHGASLRPEPWLAIYALYSLRQETNSAAVKKQGGDGNAFVRTSLLLVQPGTLDDTRCRSDE